MLSVQRGFTLIELMIAVAIVGILAAIALPGYQSSVRKAYRADAQSYLMDLAQREQQYFADWRAYTTNTTSTGLNDPAPNAVTPYYNVTISTTTPCTAGTPAPYFCITATAINTQVPDGNLTIDNTGAKTPSSMW